MNEEPLTSSILKSLIASSKSYISDIEFNGNIQPSFPTVMTTGGFINLYTNVYQSENLLSFKVNSLSSQETAEIKVIEFITDTDNQLSKLEPSSLRSIFAKREMQSYYMQDFSKQSYSDDRLKNKIIEISKETNVLSPFTAFIAVVKYENGTESKSTDVSLEFSEYETPIYRTASYSIAPIRSYSQVSFGSARPKHRKVAALSMSRPVSHQLNASGNLAPALNLPAP